MPVRATKRGAERTPLERDCDVLVCGASFAGLAVARELAGIGARVLMIDRYEIGERQTSACAMPDRVAAARWTCRTRCARRFDELVVHTPLRTARWPLPWSFSTFDYRELCALLWEQADAASCEFETATVTGRDGVTRAHRPRRAARAADRRRARLAARAVQRGARSSRRTRASRAAWRSTRTARGEEMELWIDPRYIRAGYSLELPRRRRAARRRRLVLARRTTSRSRPCGSPRDLGLPPERLPGQLDPPPAAPRRSRTACSSSATRPGTACR